MSETAFYPMKMNDILQRFDRIKTANLIASNKFLTDLI